MMAFDTVVPVGERDEVILMRGDGLLCVDKITKAKNAVCFIHSNGNGNLKRGSGFFATVKIRDVEHKCIVTNNHVIGCKEDADVAFARFSYEGNSPGKEVPLRPDVLFFTDFELDYTIVGCESNTIEHTFGIHPLAFTDKVKAYIGDQIFIFQHPKGNAKQVSYEKISDVKIPYVYYQADTDIGSSGSPVLKQFEVLAIHSKGCDRYNKGTLCSDVLDHLNYRQSKSSSISPMIECADNDRKRISQESQGNDDSMSPKRPRLSGVDPSDDEKLSQCPSDEVLQRLAKESVDCWKHLGRRLGLPESKIKEIHKDNMNYDDIVEKTYAMLQAWKEKASSATLLNLGNALKSLNKNATCQAVCGF